MNTGSSRRMVFLAALLHDIGKVGQRAESPTNSELRGKGYEKTDLAPTDPHGSPYHTHVWWTNHWIEKYESLFKGLGVWEAEGEKLPRVAARHHRKWENLSPLERIVSLADNISSGVDRSSPDDEKAGERFRDLQLTGGTQRYKKLRLLSIWAAIRTGDQEANPIKNQYWAYPLAPLSLTSGIFPQHYSESQSQLENYKTLRKEFNEAFNKYKYQRKIRNVTSSDFRGVADTLLHLIQKYFWAVPSSSYDVEPIIGLYDHLKTTAAFALALHDWIREEERRKTLLESHTKQAALENIAREKPFLLVGGDVSGIQAFIYDVYSSKAKKALKGRSFYLQLLVEVLIEKILRHPDIEAYRSNVLYASGGKFFLLLPNTEKVKKALKAIHLEAITWLWENYQNALYIGMDWIPFGFYSKKGETSWEKRVVMEGKDDADVAELWDRLHQQLHRHKTTRWKALFEDGDFLAPHPCEDGQNGGPSGTDSGPKFSYFHLFECAEEGGTLGYISGEKGGTSRQADALTGRMYPISEMEEDEEAYFHSSSLQHVRLGQELATARWILLRRVPATTGEKTEKPVVAQVFRDWQIVIPGKEDVKNLIGEKNAEGVLWRLNHVDEWISVEGVNAGISRGFYFYGGNRRPLVEKEYRPASFEELVRPPEEQEVRDPFITVPIEGTQSEKADGKEDWIISPAKDAGRSHLGILRSDVDSLGLLFQKGLPPHQRTFSALSMLSWQLQWFFSGYINTIQAAEKRFRHHLEIVYSGGDDLFAVGRWDVALAFARTVREHFYHFVCQRPDISISAGLAVVKAKFPIQRAAALAGEFESDAKSFVHYTRISSDGKDSPEKREDGFFKDAISVMGVPISWNPQKEVNTPPFRTNELEWVLNWTQTFVENLRERESSENNRKKKPPLSHGFLNLLNSYYHTAKGKKAIETAGESSYQYRSIRYIQWFWHLAYQLGRMKSPTTFPSLFSPLQTAYFSGDCQEGIPAARAFVLLSIAAQTALLWDRHFSPKEKHQSIKS